MIGVVLALLSTAFGGVSVVLMRKRLETSGFFSAGFFITMIGNIILWPFTLATSDFVSIGLKNILLFGVSGVLVYGIARLLYIKGSKVVGVSTSSSIFAVNPMFVSIIAVLLLKETLVFYDWAGIVIIVAGCIFIVGISNSSSKKQRVGFNKGVVYPLLASFTYTCSTIFIKIGLNNYNNPAAGVSIAYSAALVFYIVIFISSTQLRKRINFVKELAAFWKPGVFFTVAWVLSFYALSFEQVSIVASLLQIEPLLVILFTHILLKDVEKVSLKLIVGTGIIIIGVLFVIL
jgi:uncharacterized membrane protein